MYLNKSSLTLAVHSVFTALGVANSKPWQIFIKIDIKGAFVQMSLKGQPSFMTIDPKMSRYVIGLFPEWKEKMGEDGC
jgi:hypothetical protein